MGGAANEALLTSLKSDLQNLQLLHAEISPGSGAGNNLHDRYARDEGRMSVIG